MEDRLIKIHRVTKVVKGGRIFTYTSSSISGDKKFLIGFGRGKSREVLESIKKSYLKSRNNLLKINFKKKTLINFCFTKHNATKLYLFPAGNIIGLVCNKYSKLVFEMSGIKNIYSKVHGSTNVINIIVCTIKALSKI